MFRFIFGGERIVWAESPSGRVRFFAKKGEEEEEGSCLRRFSGSN